jgi:hypothetical protein
VEKLKLQIREVKGNADVYEIFNKRKLGMSEVEIV